MSRTDIDFKIGADLKQFRGAMGNIDHSLKKLSGGFGALGGAGFGLGGGFSFFLISAHTSGRELCIIPNMRLQLPKKFSTSPARIGVRASICSYSRLLSIFPSSSITIDTASRTLPLCLKLPIIPPFLRQGVRPHLG